MDAYELDSLKHHYPEQCWARDGRPLRVNIDSFIAEDSTSGKHDVGGKHDVVGRNDAGKNDSGRRGSFFPSRIVEEIGRVRGLVANDLRIVHADVLEYKVRSSFQIDTAGGMIDTRGIVDKRISRPVFLQDVEN